MKKTVEAQQVQFLDRTVDVPVVMQRKAPQQRIRERTVEETIDVPVPHVMEKITEIVKHTPQERLRSEVPMPQTMKEIMEVSELLPQEQILERVVKGTDVPVFTHDGENH